VKRTDPPKDDPKRKHDFLHDLLPKDERSRIESNLKEMEKRRQRRCAGRSRDPMNMVMQLNGLLIELEKRLGEDDEKLMELREEVYDYCGSQVVDNIVLIDKGIIHMEIPPSARPRRPPVGTIDEQIARWQSGIEDLRAKCHNETRQERLKKDGEGLKGGGYENMLTNLMAVLNAAKVSADQKERLKNEAVTLAVTLLLTLALQERYGQMCKDSMFILTMLPLYYKTFKSGIDLRNEKISLEVFNDEDFRDNLWRVHCAIQTGEMPIDWMTPEMQKRMTDQLMVSWINEKDIIETLKREVGGDEEFKELIRKYKENEGPINEEIRKYREEKLKQWRKEHGEGLKGGCPFERKLMTSHCPSRHWQELRKREVLRIENNGGFDPLGLVDYRDHLLAKFSGAPLRPESHAIRQEAQEEIMDWYYSEAVMDCIAVNGKIYQLLLGTTARERQVPIGTIEDQLKRWDNLIDELNAELDERAGRSLSEDDVEERYD
jgi:hypothetical protein